MSRLNQLQERKSLHIDKMNDVDRPCDAAEQSFDLFSDGTKLDFTEAIIYLNPYERLEIF